jgi:putative tryptophan/tyrosine transport system substrate-binding protein
MSEDVGCADRFLCAPLATVTRPISDLRLLISGLFPLPFALSPLLLALSLVSAMLLALCVPADAQQPAKVPRIGFLANTKLENSSIESFRRGLQALGYTEGKDIHVEYRYYETKRELIPPLTAELVHMNVDVLIVGAPPAIRAARQATKTIPIVMVTNQDPVAAGYVNSLAHPGANTTGVTNLTRELSGKRLELLKEIVPRLSRVGILWNVDAQDIGFGRGFKEYEAAARSLKIPLQSMPIRASNLDFDGAFRVAAKARVNGVITLSHIVLNPYRKEIAGLAIKYRLPSMGEIVEYAEAGGLVTYSADEDERYRRAAWYVDKILKGAKPAELPVEQPTKFELIINLKTAKQIGLTVPQSVLFRADRVIK